MKNLFIALSVLFSSIAVAQDLPLTYKADFKIIFDAAKSYYKTDKTGEATKITDEYFTSEIPCKSHFQNSAQSRLVTDKEEVTIHQVLFTGGKTLEETQTFFKKIAEVTKTLVPLNYKVSTTVNLKYDDKTSTTFELNSDVFAQVAKKPSVVMGIIKKQEAYYVEILVMGPVLIF